MYDNGASSSSHIGHRCPSRLVRLVFSHSARRDQSKGLFVASHIRFCLNKLDDEILAVEEMPRDKKSAVPLKWIQTGAYVQTPIETRSLSAYLQDRLLFQMGWPTPDRAECPLCLDTTMTNRRLPTWKEKQTTWCWSHQYQIWTAHVVANLVTQYGGNVEAFQDAWKQHSASS